MRNPLILYGGAEQDRTVDLMTASHALSQLSYSPTAITKVKRNPGFLSSEKTFSSGQKGEIRCSSVPLTM